MAAITLGFAIGGESPHLRGIFFASIQVLCMLQIDWQAWRWEAFSRSRAASIGRPRSRSIDDSWGDLLMLPDALGMDGKRQLVWEGTA